MDGEWQQMDYITPGYENSEAGFAAYQATRTVESPALAITEVMASNGMTITDAQGAFSDWVEIANVSGGDYDLSGCGLSDDPDDPAQVALPRSHTGCGRNAARILFGAIARVRR